MKPENKQTLAEDPEAKEVSHFMSGALSLQKRTGELANQPIRGCDSRDAGEEAARKGAACCCHPGRRYEAQTARVGIEWLRKFRDPAAVASQSLGNPAVDDVEAGLATPQKRIDANIRDARPVSQRIVAACHLGGVGRR